MSAKSWDTTKSWEPERCKNDIRSKVKKKVGFNRSLYCQKVVKQVYILLYITFFGHSAPIRLGRTLYVWHTTLCLSVNSHLFAEISCIYTFTTFWFSTMSFIFRKNVVSPSLQPFGWTFFNIFKPKSVVCPYKYHLLAWKKLSFCSISWIKGHRIAVLGVSGIVIFLIRYQNK